MTRLRFYLLAGTILPALILTPFGIASAQAPDQGERHGGRQQEGGPRGEGKGRGENRGERAGGERHQGGPGARENAQGERNGPRGARSGEDGPRGGEGKRARGGEGDHPNRGEAQRGGDEPRRGRKAADDGPKTSPGEKANEPNRAAQSREERRDRRETGRDREDNGPRGGDRTRAGDRDNNRAGGNRDRAEDRRDNERARDNRDRAEDRRDNERRGNDRAGDRRDNDRAGDRRDNDRRDNDRAGDRRDNDRRDNDRRFGDDRRPGPGGPGPAVVVSPVNAGGFLPPTRARRLDDLRRERREVREGDAVFIREPGRTIVRENGRAFIVHDETDRYRALGLNVRRERRGEDFVDVVVRPGGEEILTYTDPSGRMLRRVRRGRDGREFVLIDNRVGGRVGAYANDVVVLPPPPLRIPRDRYIVDYRNANANVIYDTLSAPPLAAPPRRYTLDQVRYSPDVRNYVRSVDINTINFDSGSWDVPAAATGKLEALATAINRAVERNPNSVFLIEGYTDATGNPEDNLSLSDRRAQAVAEILTKDFKVPPENLTTQGYGQQNPKEDTQGPSEVNRRVVVRNITQLLAAGGDQPPGDGQQDGGRQDGRQ